MKVGRRIIRRFGLYPRVGQMFFGQYEHNIDEKGRITIPAQYRDMLYSGAYITRGFDNNLIIYRTEDFDSLYHKIKGLSITKPKARKLARQIFANAALLELDKSGRILIPQFLRDAAKLKKAITIVGIGPYFEIWSAENWSTQTAEFENDEERANYYEDLEITFNRILVKIHLIPHQPVLYHESLKYLQPTPEGKYLDGTLGAGGHGEGIFTSAFPIRTNYSD